MSNISKEILRDYVREQNFTSSNEVLDLIFVKREPTKN